MLYSWCAILFLSSVFGNLPLQVSGALGHGRLVIAGTVVAIHDNSLSIRIGNSVSTIHVYGDATIWRGGSVRLQDLRAGDEVIVAYHLEHGEKAAIDIDANVVNWAGTITRVDPHSIIVAREDEQGDPLGRATIFIDSSTNLDETSMKDMKVGGFVQMVGLDLGKRQMRATKLVTVTPPKAKTP